MKRSGGVSTFLIELNLGCLRVANPVKRVRLPIVIDIDFLSCDLGIGKMIIDKNISKVVLQRTIILLIFPLLILILFLAFQLPEVLKSFSATSAPLGLPSVRTLLCR